MYEVTTRTGFRGPRRRRAGIEVARGGKVLVELTKEQLAAIEADSDLVVREVKDAPKSNKSSSKPKAKKDAPKQMIDNPEAKEL